MGKPNKNSEAPVASSGTGVTFQYLTEEQLAELSPEQQEEYTLNLQIFEEEQARIADLQKKAPPVSLEKKSAKSDTERIKALTDIKNLYIAGNRYTIPKGTVRDVPSYVASILRNGGDAI